MKDITLVCLPDWIDHDPLMYFPLSIMTLAAVCRNAGYEVAVADLRDGIKPLPEARYYGFSCATPQIQIAKRLSREVKGITIIGGAHASLLPQDCVRHFDYVVVGEGDEILLDILANQAHRGIIQAPRIKDLDSVPYGAWDMVPHPFSETLYPGERYGRDDLAATLIGSRGCPFHCDFCLPKDTKILMSNMTWKNIQDMTIGDEIVGVEKNNQWHYKYGAVLQTFTRKAEVFEIITEKGIVRCTKDHKWLMHNGWRSLQDIDDSAKCNASIHSVRSALRHVSAPQQQLPETDDYKKGYISGAILGDGHIAERRIKRPYGEYKYWRMQLVGDSEMLDRTLTYAHDLGFQSVHERKFNGGIYVRCNRAVVCERSKDVEQIYKMIIVGESDEWKRGFLAGIYDAEGSCNVNLRFSNQSENLKHRIKETLKHFGFESIIESKTVLLHGGRPEIVRFFALTTPSVVHKRQAIKDGDRVNCSSQILSVKSLGEMDVFDIHTTTESFVADGFVSHNCGNIQRAPVVFRSADNIIGEIKELMKFGIKHFRFEDDNITIHPKLNYLCEELRKLDIHFKAHTRSDLLTLDKALLLKSAGCEELGLGIESADDKVLALIHKGETAQDHLRATKILKQAGLRIKTYWVTGLPGETTQTIELNKSFVREAQIDKWTVSTFTPYPGCSIFRAPGLFKVEIVNHDWSKWWNFCQDSYNHILIGQTQEEMWARYLYFYGWLKNEKNWKDNAKPK